MTHATIEPGTTCPGWLRADYYRWSYDLPPRAWRCSTCRRRFIRVLGTIVPSLGYETEASSKPIPITAAAAETSPMKLRLSINRKAGAPGYGSDGAAAELELELTDDAGPQRLLEQAETWYHTLERAVDAQLATMQRQHDQADGQHQQPGPSGPPRTQPAVETAAAPSPPPAGRPNGYGGPPRSNGSNNSRGGRDDPPRNGSQLLGWAYSHDCGDALKAMAKEVGRGPIKTWADDMVEWAYTELTRQQQPAGQWGGRG